VGPPGQKYTGENQPELRGKKRQPEEKEPGEGE